MTLNKSRILAVLSAVLLLTACGGRALVYREGDPATLAGRVEQFVEAVREQQEDLTEEQWTEAAVAFEAYTDEAAAVFGKIGREDKRRIARAAGVWSGIRTRRAAAGVKSLLEDAQQMVPEFLDGLTGENTDGDDTDGEDTDGDGTDRRGH